MYVLWTKPCKLILALKRPHNTALWYPSSGNYQEKKGLYPSLQNLTAPPRHHQMPRPVHLHNSKFIKKDSGWGRGWGGGTCFGEVIRVGNSEEFTDHHNVKTQ